MNIELANKELLAIKKKFSSQRFVNMVDDYLSNAAAELESDIVKNINDKGMTDTGRLSQSIESKRIGELTYQVGTDVNYAPYLEFGTKPHTPPLQPILRWVRRKLGFADESAENIAWSIIHKISRKGTKARNYFKDSYESYDFKKLLDRVQKGWLDDN